MGRPSATHADATALHLSLFQSLKLGANHTRHARMLTTTESKRCSVLAGLQEAKVTCRWYRHLTAAFRTSKSSLFPSSPGPLALEGSGPHGCQSLCNHDKSLTS